MKNSDPQAPAPAVATSRAEETYRIVEEAVLGLWNVVDDLSRIEPPSRDFYRVTIFGSARIQPGEPLYHDVRRLACELAAMGCDIVTGGGPGLMQAANEGERFGDRSNRTQSFGLRIDLEFEQRANPFVDRLFKHRTFFSRLHHFVRLSSAYVVVSGGIGTTLETMLVWQLLQVRHLHGTPLILVGSMWRDLVDWARGNMTGGGHALADPIDMEIPTCVASVEEAIEVLRPHHAQWLADKDPRTEQ